MKNKIKLMLIFASAILSSSAFSGEIEKDKKLHFGVSALVYTASELVIDDWRYSLPLCLGVGIAKETYDEVSYGGFSKEDVYYDAAGCVSGLILYELTGKLISIIPKSDGAEISTSFKF